MELKYISTAEPFKCECSVNNKMFLGEDTQKKLDQLGKGNECWLNWLFNDDLFPAFSFSSSSLF